MLKTTISLPATAQKNWRLHQKKIHEYLSAHLRMKHGQKVRRVGLMAFNDCTEGLVRINVYWSQEIYDQLHAVAHALRMSVSHLLWQILNFVLSGRLLEKVFSNYAMKVQEWSPNAFVYTEVIQFSQRTHTKPSRKTPYRFTR